MASGDLQRGATQDRLTLFALATGAPPTAVAIVRLTGPAAFIIATQLTRRALPPPRRLARRSIVDLTTGETIDEGLVVAFPGPASVTGDDLVEFHVHGGVAVVATLLDRLSVAGATPAAAGAMTRRAFDNGKIDLAQVEALGDLIAAETVVQRRAALARTGDGLGRIVDGWRGILVAVRADLEAALDFTEEDGVALTLSGENREKLRLLATEVESGRAAAIRGGRLRDGVTVAIVGAVNAGKSTLLNALARRDAAIVSPQPGTTRDLIEVPVELAGMRVTFIDTAGMREAGDAIEAEGIHRGQARADDADLVIAFGPSKRRDAIIVVGKSDLTSAGPGWRDGAIHLSALTGDGLDPLEAEIIRRLRALVQPADPPLIAHRWQMAALDAALDAIRAAEGEADPVIAAEELRHATRALERLIGRVTSEALLDHVFARFCIGK